MVKRFNHQEFGLISRIATVGTWQLIYEFEYLTWKFVAWFGSGTGM